VSICNFEAKLWDLYQDMKLRKGIGYEERWFNFGCELGSKGGNAWSSELEWQNLKAFGPKEAMKKHVNMKEVAPSIL
jgi:hypothetical protein